MECTEPSNSGASASNPVIPEPIAIVGMGCRWPGGVRNTSQLWELLKNGKDGWAKFQADRINLDGYYHPNGQRPGSMFTTGAHLLQEDPRYFDHAFFGISAAEALSMDPSQRKLLEVTYEAFENAGEPWHKFSGSRTGVFIGNFNNEHQVMQFRDLDHPLPYVVTGGGATILSNRISHVFNLRGPSMVVDTACSASMYALHLAILSLRNEDCDAAIVGSGNLILNPEAQLFTTKLNAISPTSRSHTFDAAADGYSRAEGFGAIYVKRLSDALAQGDPIRAVVRGTSFNANGKTGGISHPSPEGQEAVIRQAYKSAGLSISGTGYFECHGTGTPVGDPIEVAAIGRVFAAVNQDEPLLIGSIKPNLGHSEPASALAQIMKAVLAMEHEEIPATIGIEKLNPAIDFDKAHVEVVRSLRQWPSAKLRRVSINSFGYGGANAHCILDHPTVVLPKYRLGGRALPITQDLNGVSSSSIKWDDHKVLPQTNNCFSPSEWIQSPKAEVRRIVLIPVSSHDDRALDKSIRAIAGAASRYKLADLLYTLGARRSCFNLRAFAVMHHQLPSRNLDVNLMTVSKAPSAVSQKICYIFTGQGAQWPAMGVKLMNEYGVFRNTIRYLDLILGQLHERPTWRIEDVLRDSSTTSRIHEPAFAQTICTALQISLVHLLRHWGIAPSVTIGHSSGEIAAAYAAGRLLASEAIIIAYFRGQAMLNNKQDGLMIAVGLGAKAIKPYLVGFEEEVRIAAINSPESTTLSGGSAAILTLVETFLSHNVFTRILKTNNNAYHSHHMLSLGEDYENKIRSALHNWNVDYSEPRQPLATWISSVNPETQANASNPRYWRQNLESTVCFSDAFSRLARDMSVMDLAIEIGPHTALYGPYKQIRKVEPTLPPYLGSLKRGKDDVDCMLTLAGHLYLNNAPVDLVAVNASEQQTKDGNIRYFYGYPCVDMPQYSFSYPEKPLYLENRFNREVRQRRYLRHDLLGSRQAGGSASCPSWRNILKIKDLPWLADHKLVPLTVLPAAAYLTMAAEAARQIHNEQALDEGADFSPIHSIKLRTVAIKSAMRLEESEHGIETITHVERLGPKSPNFGPIWYKFIIESMPVGDGGSWTENCSGEISVETRETKIDQYEQLSIDPQARLLDVNRWYDEFLAVGLSFGPTFQCLSKLQAYRASRSAAAQVSLNSTDGTINGGESEYFTLHPTAIDACLQLALIAVHAGQVENSKRAFVPVFLDNVSLWVSDLSQTKAQAVACGQFIGERSAHAKTQLFSNSGRPLLFIGDMRCVMFHGSARHNEFPDTAYEPYWKIDSMVDVVTLSNEQAQRLFSPATRSGSEDEQIEELCKHVLVDMERIMKEHPTDTQALSPSPFALWIQDTNILSTSQEISKLNVDEIQSNIRKGFSDLNHILEVRCIEEIHNNIERVLSDKTDITKLLIDNALLDQLYSCGISVKEAHNQLRKLVDLFTHKHPRSHILEVDGGTGGATASVLEVLGSKFPSFKRFESYTFTDPADWCVAGARAKFSDYRGVNYHVFDIRQDSQTQELAGRSFDLIIATDSMGRFSNDVTFLRNASNLLRPGGALILVKPTRKRLYMEILSRSSTGSWCQKYNIRGLDEWNQCLMNSGFFGAHVALDDYAGDESLSTTIIAFTLGNPQGILETSQPKRNIYLVYRDYPPPLAGYISKVIEQYEYRCIYVSLSSCDQVPLGASVISLADSENSTLLQSSSECFEQIQSLVAKSSVLAWITTFDAGVNYSESAVMKGILRSVATENVNMKVAYLEICKSESYFNDLSRTAELITYKIFQMESSGPDSMIDRECILRDGSLHIQRLVPDARLNEAFRLRNKLQEDMQESLVDTKKALKPRYKNPGLLSSMYFEPDQMPSEPLKEGWVQIRTQAIGLNMKDIAVATARYDSNYQSHEGSGDVCQVGPGVGPFKIGDRVFGLMFGNMSTYLRCPVQYISKIPEGESYVSAASLPISYLAAMYALQRLARIEKGETVLIESAAGSLGIAAMQIAKHLGAEIYVTVGSDGKRDFIIKNFGLPPSQIFRSRHPTLIEDIMRATRGRGIDVILSTTQHAMHEMWRCIAPLGRFIDLGRTAVLGAEKLSLEIFQRNATFASFDIVAIALEKPQVIEELMCDLKRMWTNGIVVPVAPITSFEISQLASAMSFFTKGQHMGKVVLDFNKSTIPAKVLRDMPQIRLDPDAGYLFAGGLGGLGRSLSCWMVERGARHIIYLSRSGSKRLDVDSFLKRLADMGACPEVFSCDITSLDSLTSTISRVSTRLRIRGLIHAAMIEGDALFSRTTYSQVQAVLAPKVAGTVNLHLATRRLPLDFFLMTSSTVGVIGTSTQSAYCAANAFQNEFARQRRSEGLPATSLDLGLILEVGSVSQAKNVQQSLQRVATYGQSETEFLQLVEGVLCAAQDDPRPCSGSQGHIITGLEPRRFVAQWENNRASDLVWYKDARFQSVVQAISDQARSRPSAAMMTTRKSQPVSMRLTTAGSLREKTTIVQEAISAYISGLLGVSADEINVNKAMSNYGLDSLVVPELQNWFSTNFGMKVTTIQLLGEEATVANLARRAIEGIQDDGSLVA
ncbi:putative polyketide synthase [Xylaria bambusicola]|uniref:putative polyketide synthase n=1 Tax=Xylaria bambusicola TaxID=326684 RepID=UPI0020078B2B|nr:putative polyketide synthase [Xylaria bambusicola]KAI0521826.1 putative polyketide synthase [Xylaria bambusicola]